MSISDKIKNAKQGNALFDGIPPERMYALKLRARISTAIFNERKRRGLSQKEFADLCGVAQAMVSKWESGEYNFSVDAWAKLSHKLGLSFEPNAWTSKAAVSTPSYQSRSSTTSSDYAGWLNVVDFQAYKDSLLKEN